MRFFILIFFLFINSDVLAQPLCSEPGRTPETAIAVCGSLTFTQNDVSTCSGLNIPAMQCPPPVAENVYWYRLHCYQTGTLGFILTPLAPTDIDWTLIDITGRPATDAFSTDLSVSINLSEVRVPTGCRTGGAGDFNCRGNTPVFNQMPTITAGRDYLLMVSRFSSFTTQGYTLNFTGGTAVLTDNQDPAVLNVGPAGCNTSQVRIAFSENILCSSITAAGSEFTVTDGTTIYPFNSITSLCSTGQNAITTLSLNMQDPLLPGNYNLVINEGTDGNTLQDVCLDQMLPGPPIPFTITAQPELSITDVTYTGCAPTILKVALNKPVFCSSISTNGSDFSISPINPVISSVQTVCSGAESYTDTILIFLQSPLPPGGYQLSVKIGSDGNTLLDVCGTPLPVGYQFPFFIAQTTTAPVIQSVVFDECKPFKLLVNFNKSISCASFSALGSEFSITPGTLTVTNATSVCTGGLVTQIELTLSDNLPAGNFNVTINNGPDGNTISDSCLSFIPLGHSYPFTTTQTPLPVYDSLQYDKCAPSFIRVFYSKAILCSSINLDGSEFSITGPMPVNISSVNTNATCTSGYTNSIVLNLSQPLNTSGTFVLHNVAGTDGNSVMDTCHTAQNINETISFDVLYKPSAAFEDSVYFGCVTDTLVVSHPGGNGINFWQWTFSDGTIVTGASASHEFPVTTPTASVQLIVSNGICSDTLSRTYTLNNAFVAGFTVSADTLCRNTGLSFTNTSTGNNLTYTWNFGDGNTFTGQTPPAHNYQNPGNYNITLTATNNYFCIDDSVKIVNVTDTPVVRFTGLNSQYCTGESVTLNTDISAGNVSSYSWNNGNAVITQNQSPVNFSYNAEAASVITLTATDRFCGNHSFTQSTQIYKVPVFSLGNDITLCPGMTKQIGVDSTLGYTYQWNTGAATAKIITYPASATYELIVDNHSCKATDNVFVTVLDTCLIRVPGAFTPNNDGLNDRLKAINADLAKDFQLRVYNRLGQLLYETRVPTAGWDGRLKGQEASAGTYVWQLSYIHPITGLRIFDKGTSILIR